MQDSSWLVILYRGSARYCTVFGKRIRGSTRGHAVTNHSSQGQTADSIPVHRLVTVGRHTLSQCPPRFSGIVNATFWRFRSTVENFQVAVICEEPMALLAGRLTNHAELDHVLQSLRHGGRREGELPCCRGDRDNRPSL